MEISSNNIESGDGLMDEEDQPISVDYSDAIDDPFSNN